jgi:hypothetical protein
LDGDRDHPAGVLIYDRRLLDGEPHFARLEIVYRGDERDDGR